MEPRARHIMFAYDIQGQKGSCDDGEFFGDLQIAKHLKKTETKDVAVFVTRLCGPHQLGAKRFQIIRTLVDELLQIMQRAEDSGPVDEAWVDVVAPRHVDDYNAAERLKKVLQARRVKDDRRKTPECKDQESAEEDMDH